MLTILEPSQPRVRVAREVTPTANTTYQAAPCDLKDCGATTRVFVRPVTGDPRMAGWWESRCVVCGAPYFWRPPLAPKES